MTDSNAQPLWPQHFDDHYGHLANTLPRWLIDASPARRAALRATVPQIRQAFKNTSPAHHQVLKRANAAYWAAQNGVDQRLQHLQDARTFGEPLLRDALKRQYGLDLDVNSTFLRLYIPASIPWFPIRSGAARTWTVSLLDAALHNFEPSEAEDDAYQDDSTYITQPSSAGLFEVLGHIKAQLTIADFVRLCRELDIGSQYQTWLEDNLGVSNPVTQAVLQPQVKASHKAALRLALELALTDEQALTTHTYNSMLGLINEVPGMLLDGKPLLCHDLMIMSARVTGIVLFAPDLELNRNAVRVVAYIPDDPQAPLKEYPSSAHFMADLTRKLRSPDYQRFFSRFINHADRGYFFANLNNRLSEITWHPHTPGDPQPVWRETPAPHTNLQFSATVIRANLWEHLYQRQLDKILNDGRTLAVSTASSDRKQRWERWESFTRIATTLLEIALFVALPFVPFLGELMLAYTAYQLLDDTFEGVLDWAQGQTRQAFEHTMAVLETLVQLGIFAAGAHIVTAEFRQALPREWVDFIDRFTPAKTPDGRTRYWNGDLGPYQQTTPLPARSQPDQQGLHTVGENTLLALENSHYAVRRDPASGQFRIEHPTRPDAYSPRLEHNGHGTWHTELEQPLTWDRATLLRRLGHLVDTLSATEREQVLRISGYHENALRRMHVDHQPPPPLLADTLKRFKIDKDLQTFIQRIASQDVRTYLSADPQTQLQLLTEQLPWPLSKGLRLIDTTGQVAWRSHTGLTQGARVYDLPLDRGDVLEMALTYLTETEIKTLFDETFAAPTRALATRASGLRARLARIAQTRRGTLFEARYQALERNVDPLARRLMDEVRGLPASVAEDLVNHASGKDLQQLEQGTVSRELLEHARWAQEHVRAVRARESLELASLDNLDTDRLALHSLARLPGWSGEVRIEVTRYAFSGSVIDSIGEPGAKERKVLVQLEEGGYQACDERGETLASHDDFYNSVLWALPDSERQRINLRTGQGPQLKQLIVEHALDHGSLQKILSPHPLRKPHYDPDTMRLPGGVDGYLRLHPGARSLNDRILELYPAFNNAEVESFALTLQQHPHGARVELSRLNREYLDLHEDLRHWIQATPQLHPVTGALLTGDQRLASEHNRTMLAEQLARCWRRQTALNDGDMDAGNRGYMFRFTRPIIGELPELRADFSHVSYLILEGTPATRGGQRFLGYFTSLARMEVRNLRLATLPESIATLPNLNQVVLSNCSISLTAETEATLGSLSQLQVLDLSKNPLGRMFSLQAMSHLHYLDLAETGLTTLPPDLLSLQKLTAIILPDNLMTELPVELFDLPADKGRGYDLGGNPYNAQTRNRIKAYFQATHEDLGVYAPQADLDRAANLYPLLDREMASDFIYGLPGTLEQGRIELTRLEAEYDTLTTALAVWTAETPAVHPATGEPLSPAEELLEHNTRDELKRTIEKCWRKETEVDDFNQAMEPSFELALDMVVIGELPTLSADFSHVSHLYLRSRHGLTTVGDGFLRCFPRLKGLTIRDYRLGSLPESVFNMSQLTALVLPDCEITLTADTVMGLAGMEHLDFLDLAGNPLLLAPDVSQMPDMATLILDQTQISELPRGLLNLTRLDIANLNDNAIFDLPSALAELPAEVAERINLRGNPLSQASLRLLLDYFRRTGNDFGVEEVIHLAEMEVSESDDSTVED